MRRELVTLLALALLPLAAAGQSVKLPEKVLVDDVGLVVIRAAEFDADDLHWFAVGPGLQTFPPDLVPQKLGAFMGMAMRPGTYKLGCIPALAVTTKGPDGKEVSRARIGQPAYVTVTVGAPTPPPVPPGPDPKPPGPPVTGPLWAIVVHDATAPAPAVARLLADTKVWEEVAAKKWRHFDKDSPTVQANGYLRFQVEAGGLPMLLVLDQTGKKLRAVRLPADAAGLRQVFKEVRGG